MIALKVIRRLRRWRHTLVWKAALGRAACGDVPLIPLSAKVPPSPLQVGFGRLLPDAELAKLLANVELGSWALDGATLSLLAYKLEKDRPQAILEFGAGTSTLALGALLRRHHDDDQVRLYSLEQNALIAEQTRERLQHAGLQKAVRVFFAPLQEQKIEGVTDLCYTPDQSAIRELEANAARIEWVLVDGPAGDDLVRFGTLPCAHNWVAPGARWFLDDARRNEERAVLRKWAQLPFLTVEGTFAVGKGLACGRFVRS